MSFCYCVVLFLHWTGNCNSQPNKWQIYWVEHTCVQIQRIKMMWNCIFHSIRMICFSFWPWRQFVPQRNSFCSDEKTAHVMDRIGENSETTSSPVDPPSWPDQDLDTAAPSHIYWLTLKKSGVIVENFSTSDSDIKLNADTCHSDGQVLSAEILSCTCGCTVVLQRLCKHFINPGAEIRSTSPQTEGDDVQEGSTSQSSKTFNPVWL